MDIRYLGASKRYSEAVVANGLVFLSGMVPENPEADAKAQTENVLAQIDSWLAQCQSDKAHFRSHHLSARYERHAAMNEAWVHGQLLNALRPAPAWRRTGFARLEG